MEINEYAWLAEKGDTGCWNVVQLRMMMRKRTTDENDDEKADAENDDEKADAEKDDEKADDR